MLERTMQSENISVIEQVKEFMKKECFKRLNKPVAAIRLENIEGKNNNARPIKLIFEIEPSKWEFVK